MITEHEKGQKIYYINSIFVKCVPWFTLQIRGNFHVIFVFTFHFNDYLFSLFSFRLICLIIFLMKVFSFI